MDEPNRLPRNYPVMWDQSNWENQCWRPEQTHPAVQALIEKTATDCGRAEFINVVVPTPAAFELSWTTGIEGNLSHEIADCAPRAVALAHSIGGTMRALAREEAARLIRQVDIPDQNGTMRRTIVVRWDRQRKTVAAQLEALRRAVEKRSQYAIEAAWFGLTRRAQEYVGAGYELARRRGDLGCLAGPSEVLATIIRVSMPSPDLLAIILPYAEKVNSFPGSRPVHQRDAALAEVSRIYSLISGSSTGSLRRGDCHGPVGPGADFVAAIEAIYDLKLVTSGSTHSVARAKRRPAERHD